MNTLDFLKLVWPTTGLYLVAHPISGVDRQTQQPWKSYKHFPCATPEEAENLVRHMAYDGTDAYFALGSVREDLTQLKKADREALGKKVRGVHRKSGYDNTAALRAFWLDLDVKADPNAYPTQADALTALRDFCMAMRLPRPLIVNSGGGIHAYWILDADIDAERWQHYANILKALTVSWKLRADPSRTADRASILRPVGTTNWKTGTARPVQALNTHVPVDTNEFLKRLAYLSETVDLPPVQVRPAQMVIAGTPLVIPGSPLIPVADISQMNAGAAAGAGYAKADPQKVIQKCQQLAWQNANQGSVNEPSWYNMIGCLRHADQSYKAVHFLSRRSPTYSKDATDLKIIQSEEANYPPTTCAKFESDNPGGCQGCPFRGKIKTPLQVVRELQTVPPPVVQLQTAQGPVAVQMPDPPKPFKRVINPMTGNARIAITESNEDGDVDVVIYENDLYPERIIWDERSNTYTVVVRSFLPQDGWRNSEIPMGMLYEKRTLAAKLGNAGIMPDLKHVEAVVQYMIAYIRDLQKLAKSSTIFAQLGWRPEMDRFILPDRVVTATGSEPANISKNIVNALDWKEAKGSLDEWKRIVAAYEKPGMEAHQFGFGVGFASPLFLHTNFSGMVVSMIGAAGAGKSSSAYSANSIWGHPKMGWADAEHDTMKAFYNKLGVLHNLPATYDEHTNLDPEIVSDMCYMVSKGRGRQRLEQNGAAAENHGNWQLMMLMTGNRSLNSRLAAYKADSSAESSRVFEYKVPSNTMPKADADALWGVNGAIFRNYGVAGEIYARQLLASQDWARERIQHWVQEVDRLANVTSGERFWSAGVACVLTGFELANQCGLTNVDIQRLLDFAVTTIGGMRQVVQDNTRNPANAVSDYLTSNMNSLLIVDAPTQVGRPTPVIHSPRDKLKARIERDTHTLFIDRADFKRFCARGQIDGAHVMQVLTDLGVVRRQVRVVLGKGTSLGTVQSWCWELDISHAELLGLGQMAVVQVPPVTGHLALVP